MNGEMQIWKMWYFGGVRFIIELFLMPSALAYMPPFSSFIVALMGLLGAPQVSYGQNSPPAVPQFKECQDHKYPKTCSQLKWKQWQHQLQQELPQSTTPSLPANIEAQIKVSMTGSAQLMAFESFLAPSDYRRAVETAVADLGPIS